MDFMDFQEELLETSRDYIDLANDYRSALRATAHYFNQLIVLVERRGLHKSKKSTENKIIELLADAEVGAEAKELYKQMLEQEADSKGLKEVCKAYANHSMALMSTMKSQQMGEMTEGVKNKYIL